ncbi:MAG: hypothetical protein FWG51_00280 [Firmicutes bacterium]|nr:hypothetical protein [Bacillota bacterium]
MAKKYKIKKRDGLFSKLVLGIARRVKKTPQIINLNEDGIERKSIMIANHNGAGVTAYRIFLKQKYAPRFMTWTAFQVTKGFFTRWKYLYHVFYRKKLKYSKLRSFILATLLGTVYPLVRIIVGFIPVYFDLRLRDTLQHSLYTLEKGYSVFITPENAEKGYQKKEEGYPQEIEQLFKGFLVLSKKYYEKNKIDLPIYTIIYTTFNNNKKLVIGKPMYYQELLKNHSQAEILEIFRDYMNFLYKEYSYSKEYIYSGSSEMVFSYTHAENDGEENPATKTT